MIGKKLVYRKHYLIRMICRHMPVARLILRCREDEEVRLLPVVSCFDLRATFAPAIVYSSKVDCPVLVCGHSMEVNATSDIDFYVSVDQLQLFLGIWDTNIGCLLDTSSSTSSSKSFAQNSTPTTELDSGMGSESTVSVICQPSAGIANRSEMSSFNWLATCKFDMFLTAKRISLMLYQHDLSVAEHETLLASAAAEEQGPSGEGLALFCPESVEDTLHKVPAVLPLFHVAFAQPHSFIICNGTIQKIELSCYDVALKGPQILNPVTTSSDELKFVPELSDFPVHWLETKPGKANPKTGIPACLYTLKILDYLGSSGLIPIYFYRVSCPNFKHKMFFMDDVFPSAFL
jgi:vacuolar protein sorting-associated protein 13B